ILNQDQEPLFRIPCAGPVRNVVGDVKSGKAEEAGSFWLWVWPQLINWPSDITWLFSPVVGRKRPGDLWRVDAKGNLLMVESKRSDTAMPHDPFEDFVSHKIPDVGELRKHWRSCLDHEKAFIQEHLAALRGDRLALGYYPGLVPY